MRDEGGAWQGLLWTCGLAEGGGETGAKNSQGRKGICPVHAPSCGEAREI